MTTPKTATPGRLQFPTNLTPNAIRGVRYPKFPIDMAISDSGLETRKLDASPNTGTMSTQHHYHFQLTLVYDYRGADFIRLFNEFYLGKTIGHWRAFEIPQSLTRFWCMVPGHMDLHRWLHPLWRFEEAQIDLESQLCSHSAWKITLLNLKGEDLLGSG